MEDREYKRLRRLIIRSFMALLVILVAITFAGSYQLKYLKSQLASKSNRQVVQQTIVQQMPPTPEHLQLVEGPEGKKGDSVQGQPGESITGAAGENATADQIAVAVANYLKTNPPASGKDGEKGAMGAAGKVVFVNLNILTGLWECRYGTDLQWQPIEECK